MLQAGKKIIMLQSTIKPEANFLKTKDSETQTLPLLTLPQNHCMDNSHSESGGNHSGL